MLRIINIKIYDHEYKNCRSKLIPIIDTSFISHINDGNILIQKIIDNIIPKKKNAEFLVVLSINDSYERIEFLLLYNEFGYLENFSVNTLYYIDLEYFD